MGIDSDRTAVPIVWVFIGFQRAPHYPINNTASGAEMGEADGAIACPQRRFKYLLGLGD